MTFAAVIVPLLVVWLAGHFYGHRLEQALGRRYPRSPSGIIVGAEDIVRVESNGAAVLLVHGAGDTPQTMWRLAEVLHDRGYTVIAPLLPGHGRTLAELAAHSADEWYEAVRSRYEELRQSHAWVGVVGLSMGGALSVRLAAETPDMPALVLASPYLAMPTLGGLATRASWLWGLLIPYVSTATDSSVRDPVARSASLSYGAMSTNALRALRVTARRGWRSLTDVRAPTLIIQSTTDNRVAIGTTRRAYQLLGSQDKAIEWVEGAGHVITVDYGWEQVTARIADWLDSHRR